MVDVEAVVVDCVDVEVCGGLFVEVDIGCVLVDVNGCAVEMVDASVVVFSSVIRVVGAPRNMKNMC